MLHERKQRLLCRYLFLAICIVPTLAVGSYALWRTQSNWQQQTLDSLSVRLGVRIECQSLTTPLPGTWRLEGIRLAHLETGRALGTVSHAEFSVLTDCHLCRCGETTIDEASLIDFASAVEDCLSRDFGFPIKAAFDSIAISNSQNSLAKGQTLTWQRVTANWQSRDSTSHRLPCLQVTSDDQTLLSVERRLEDGLPVTLVNLRTGSHPVPWRVVAAGSLLKPCFGELAQFQGSINRKTDGSLRSEGVVHQASLTPLIPGQLVLQEPATIRLHQLSWQNEQLAQLNATIDAGSGTASRSLVASLNEQLACEATTLLHQVWQRPSEHIAFDRLSLQVQLDSQGVRFSAGKSQHAANPGMMSANGEPLLIARHGQRLPTQQLLYLTAPERIVSLPTGQTAEMWSRHLPKSSPTSRVAEQATGHVYR